MHSTPKVHSYTKFKIVYIFIYISCFLSSTSAYLLPSVRFVPFFFESACAYKANGASTGRWGPQHTTSQTWTGHQILWVFSYGLYRNMANITATTEVDLENIVCLCVLGFCIFYSLPSVVISLWCCSGSGRD